MNWPKQYTAWIENRVLHVSIPFTWELPRVADLVRQRVLHWDRVIVGGPATALMPEYFADMKHVEVGQSCANALQRVNPLATRTSVGCIRACPFCAVRRIEGDLKELDSWPNLPVVMDNNLLACSIGHFDRVIDGLVKLGWADFNQGLDARLLTDHHAARIAEIRQPMVRLALDSSDTAEMFAFSRAYMRLRCAGISKTQIRAYALIGFNTGPEEAWQRCRFIESMKIKALPMWFHPLDAMERNTVTERQQSLRWTDRERKRIMAYFYKHRSEDGRRGRYSRQMSMRKTGQYEPAA